MRIDKPLCGFKYCKYQFDGNCMAIPVKREYCEFRMAVEGDGEK